jgi:hypothetical protein
MATTSMPVPAAAVPAPHPLLAGPILSTLLRLALPTSVAMVATALVAIAETVYVGILGTLPLAGLALVFPMVMLQQTMAASPRPSAARSGREMPCVPPRSRSTPS